MKLPALLFLLASPILAEDALKSSLVFHASFDSTLNADFSKGEKTAMVKKGKDLVPCEPNEDVKPQQAASSAAASTFPRKV
jgi:hypothetical protein